MTLLRAVFLGIVQGLGEFLPISSSAHLILVPWALGWSDDGGLAFDVALHWGTLLAVVAYFWRDWLALLAAGWRSLSRLGTSAFAAQQKAVRVSAGSSSPGAQPDIPRGMARLWDADPQARLFWMLVVATIPGGIFGLLLDKWAEHALRAPLLVGSLVGVMGAILWWADRRGRKVRSIDEVSLADALLIGGAQAFAVIPGFSRSGSTITAGLMAGWKREDIARFSFLMSTPIILGAGLVKLPALVREVHHALPGTPHLAWGPIAGGIIASAVVGFAVIRWMLDYLRKGSYVIFALWRIAVLLGVVALIAARR